MNICVLTHSFPRFQDDPTAPFMAGVCEGLSQVGNKVFVLTPESPLFKTSRNNIHYKLIRFKYAYPSSFHLLGYSQTLINDTKIRSRVYFLSPFFFLFGFLSLLQLVRKEKIDIVSAHWILPNGFIAALVKKFAKIKVVSTLPGSDVYIAKKNILFRYMAFFAAKNSDGITSNSVQLKDDLLSLGAKVNKFKHISYGVDTKFFKPDQRKKSMMRKKFRVSSDTVIVLAVGRLVEKKGLIYLIRAAHDIVHKYRNVLFVIVGDGEQKSILTEEVKKLSLEKFVRLQGGVNHSELKNYYNMADIFMLPSIRDSEGNLDDQSVSAAEAMSCGKPVVTTDFSGYRLIIDHGKDGFLVPEKNIKQIAYILLELISSPKMRKRIGEAARKKIINKLSLNKIGKEYTDFFQSL